MENSLRPPNRKTKLRKLGNSAGITISAYLQEKFNLSIGDEMELVSELDENHLILRVKRSGRKGTPKVDRRDDWNPFRGQ